MSDRGEVVVPFRYPRERIPMGTEFRSTWLTASLEALRARGLFDRYLALLPKEHHEPIVQSIAGVWLPAAIAVAHYRACDALALSTQDQIALGRDVVKRLDKTIFSLGFRAAREVGVTPWTTIKMLPAAFEREWRGGACGVFKAGPKDARIEIVGFPCSPIPYCRTALHGVVTGLCEIVCSKAYVQDVRALNTDTTMGFRVAWV
jgi:hypothetical protein